MEASAAVQTLAFIGNLGWPEILIIMVIMLILFGRRLPEVGRSLGKGIVEFKKGVKGIDEEVDQRSQQPYQPPAQPPQAYQSAAWQQPQQLPPPAQQPQSAPPMGQPAQASMPPQH